MQAWKELSVNYSIYTSQDTLTQWIQAQAFWIHALIAQFSCNNLTEGDRPELTMDAARGLLGAAQLSKYSSLYRSDINKK